jgi:hypothetical protein
VHIRTAEHQQTAKLQITATVRLQVLQCALLLVAIMLHHKQQRTAALIGLLLCTPSASKEKSNTTRTAMF